MRLKDSRSIFNMGDTSIRVKQIVDVYKVILKQLNNFMKSGKPWERNTTAQEEFYRTFLEEIVRIEKEDGIELFRDFIRLKNYTLPDPSKVGLRGRTLTNGLVKSGLIHSCRNISEVGQNYLNNKLAVADPLEQTLGLHTDNLLYLRQYLKLRIYAHDSDKYFYNFRFALKFLSTYRNVPQNDFLKILLSIKPDQSSEELHRIMDRYEAVSRNNKIFEDYYIENFSYLLRSEEELNEVKSMFINKDFTDDNFIKYFSNRDSNETSLLYKDFVIHLIKLVDEHCNDAFEKIKKLSRNDKIKKAFSGNKSPFKFTKNESLIQFIETNRENPLLHNDHYHIYLEFIFSKHNDLIREYSDMCRRAFQITGLISFDNGLVNLNDSWIIQPLLDLLGDRFKLNGQDRYDDYENKTDSLWFKDVTTTEILGVSGELFDNLMKNIGIQFGITDPTSISTAIMNKHEQEYRTFVDTHFPKDKVITILENISERNDEEVFKFVTDNATIPTIYEYILTIAWYHLSEGKSFMLHKSFQVTLDGNKLPLTHRGGGAGDIEIITNEYSLLIEATLMDMNAQKRGELEPVIRHSTNFALQHMNSSEQIQTIFIANELDHNVLNIFRAAQFIQLNGTSETGHVFGLNIFAFTTKEVIRLLSENKKDEEILMIINDNLNHSPIQIDNHWRIPIVDSIFN